MSRDLRPDLAARLDRLRRLRDVPDADLAAIVARDGLIRRPLDPADLRAAEQSDDPDRDLAARMCAGCPVLDECLELDLRWMADRTIGVFAGLTQDDRRAIHAARAADPPDSDPGSPSVHTGPTTSQGESPC